MFILLLRENVEMSWNNLEQVKFLVLEEVFHSMSTISSIISLVVSKKISIQTLAQRGWLRAM